MDERTHHLRIRDVMTPDVVTLPAASGLVEAARRMREADVGDVVVTDNDRPCGIVTDRDLVVRGVAAEAGVADLSLADVCSRQLVTISADDSIDDAVELMSANAVRRLIVMDGPELCGMVSIGDLAIEADTDSALAGISAAPAQGGEAR